jgi:hypothetical protein
VSLHIIKLSVGSESFDDMAAWQKQRLKEMKARGFSPELIHVTRMTPKRASELLDGGSIYWVVKGGIIARQKLLELRPLKKDGVPHCGLVYDKNLIPVRWQPRRAFQGWRYLDGKDAPPDLKPGEISEEAMPADMKKELRELGLL